MTPAEKRARRAWHLAILAVAPDRPLVEPWIGWARAALAWHRDLDRRRVGRYVRLAAPQPTSVADVPPYRLGKLRGRALREAIGSAVRERWAA